MFYTGNHIPVTLTCSFLPTDVMRSLHVDVSADGRTEYFDVPLYGNESSVTVDLVETCRSLFGIVDYDPSSWLSLPLIKTPAVAVSGNCTDENGFRRKRDGSANPSAIGEVALGRIPDYIPELLTTKLNGTPEYPSVDASLMPERDLVSVDGKCMVCGGHELYEGSKDGLRVYSVPPLQERLYRRFHIINTFGLSDVVFARTLESAGFELNRKAYSRVRRLGESHIGDRYVSTKPARRVYQMSSGACSDEWAEWWLYEFCNAEHIWMEENGEWLPVAVETKASSTYNRYDGNPCHIDFTVTVLTT